MSKHFRVERRTTHKQIIGNVKQVFLYYIIILQTSMHLSEMFFLVKNVGVLIFEKR